MEGKGEREEIAENESAIARLNTLCEEEEEHLSVLTHR